ncbi:unnamed protein product [Arctogadus glacialis]
MTTVNAYHDDDDDNDNDEDDEADDDDDDDDEEEEDDDANDANEDDEAAELRVMTGGCRPAVMAPPRGSQECGCVRLTSSSVLLLPFLRYSVQLTAKRRYATILILHPVL